MATAAGVGRPFGSSPRAVRDGAPGARGLKADVDGATHPEPGACAGKVSGRYERRAIAGGEGRNLPHEAPRGFVEAALDADRLAG